MDLLQVSSSGALKREHFYGKAQKVQLHKTVNFTSNPLMPDYSNDSTVRLILHPFDFTARLI